MAYGEQLSACALIIFQKQWHVDDRRLVTNQKCCYRDLYGLLCRVCDIYSREKIK